MKSVEAIKESILSDFKTIGIDSSNFELELRPYSKSYYGRYYTQRKKIVVYVYSDKDRETLYPYFYLLLTAIHELCHHLQWSDPDWNRVKGVMHDKSFWDLWHKYTSLYREQISAEERRREYDRAVKERRRI